MRIRICMHSNRSLYAFKIDFIRIQKEKSMGLYWTLQCKRLQFASYKHSFENGELSLKQ